MTEEQRARMDAYQREYRVRNAERLKEYRHRPDVKARRNETTLAWRENNPEMVRAADRAAYKAKPERKRKQSAQYRQEHPEAVKEALKAWAKANPDRRATYSRNAKARRKLAPGSHTSNDIKALQQLQRGCCAACHAKLKAFHVDHVIPLARGGTNDRLNLQLLCPPCNLSKGAKHPVDFMQSRGRLL